eukprot:1161289-Pelagomonas_calceolata.AAC.7
MQTCFYNDARALPLFTCISPGKSGAVFLLSNDDQYFVKTVKKNEVDLLCSILPRYYNHVVNHPHTLLTKFYGLHKITLKSGRKVSLAKSEWLATKLRSRAAEICVWQRN